MATRTDGNDKLSGNKMLAEYANLATVHDALAVLVGFNILTHDDRIRLTRKFMDDRPAFKKAVEAAMNAGLHAS